MITASDIQHGKPHPEPYQRGAALLGLAARRLRCRGGRAQRNPLGIGRRNAGTRRAHHLSGG